MGKKVDEHVKQIEAAALRRLIDERWGASDAAFAEECNRSRAELNQHLGCVRPMPLRAVKDYAHVLECSIEEISKRWANELSADVRTAENRSPQSESERSGLPNGISEAGMEAATIVSSMDINDQVEVLHWLRVEDVRRRHKR